MTLATDGIYGRDLRIVFTATGPDLDPGMTEVTGTDLLAQSLVLRQMCAKGTLIGFPNDGIDVRVFAGRGVKAGDIQQLQNEVAAELERDPRVKSAIVRASYNSVTKAIALTETIDCALGPFTMVLAISQVTVQLLQKSAA